MGEGYWCDLCGLGLPTPNAQQKIKIGEEEIAAACINCATNIKTTMKQHKVATDQKKRQAQAELEKAQQEQIAAEQAAAQQAQAAQQAAQPQQPPADQGTPPEVPPQAQQQQTEPPK